MMLHHFRVLSEHPQLRHLLLDGSCIAERDTESARVLLFQLGGGYVEVYFTTQGDEVLHYGSFEGTEKLEPYLASVVLDTRLF